MLKSHELPKQNGLCLSIHSSTQMENLTVSTFRPHVRGVKEIQV